MPRLMLALAACIVLAGCGEKSTEDATSTTTSTATQSGSASPSTAAPTKAPVQGSNAMINPAADPSGIMGSKAK